MSEYRTLYKLANYTGSIRFVHHILQENEKHVQRNQKEKEEEKKKMKMKKERGKMGGSVDASCEECEHSETYGVSPLME